MIKRGAKNMAIDKQAEIITKEWTSFTTEQKINMQKYLDKKLKQRKVQEGHEGKKFQKMKKNFEGKHGVEFEQIQEKDLLHDINEHQNPNLKDTLKNAVSEKNHFAQSVREICDDVDKRKKEA